MRHILLELLYEWSKIPYKKWFKKERPWDISAKELIQYPETSLGFHLGCFLLRHDFNPEPQLENHDVFHVLTQLGISVPQEIAMQFYLLGNGKRSIYLFLVLILGLTLFIDYITLFQKAFLLGRKAHSFHHLAFKSLLLEPLIELQQTFNITTL